MVKKSNEMHWIDLYENKRGHSLFNRSGMPGWNRTTEDITPLQRTDVHRSMSTSVFVLFSFIRGNFLNWFFLTWICKKAHSRTSTKLQSRQCLVVSSALLLLLHHNLLSFYLLFSFRTHAGTLTPSRAVGRSAQAAAWTCPPSFSAAWGASKEAAAWGWRVPAASRCTKTSSSPSPKPGAGRWTPPRTSWGQAWRWSEGLSSSPSLGSPQGLLVACPRSRNHRLSGYPAGLAPIEFPTMVFNPHARQVATCWEDERSLWAVHSPPQRRLARARKILPQPVLSTVWLHAHTASRAIYEGRGGVGERCLHHWLPHAAGEKARQSSGQQNQFFNYFFFFKRSIWT